MPVVPLGIAAVDVAILVLLTLLLVLLTNGDAVMDDDAVVAADTVIGVDLGTKTGALMLSADMDENTPDPVRGRRTLPLFSAVSWGGDGLFTS